MRARNAARWRYAGRGGKSDVVGRTVELIGAGHRRPAEDLLHAGGIRYGRTADYCRCRHR